MTVSRAWTFWAFIALLVVLDFILHIAIGLGATAPDLLTVALLLAARRLSSAGAAALGLVFGLLRDALSLIAFGAEAVTMTLLGSWARGPRITSSARACSSWRATCSWESGSTT